MAQSVGIILYSFLFMQLGDRWGRSKMFHLSNVITIIFRMVTLHTSNYWLILISVAIGAIYSPLGVRIAFVLTSELTNEKGRNFAYFYGWATWVCGIGLSSLIAWLTEVKI